MAKAYRVLRAVLHTAVDDGLITRNPCRIKGAADDKSPERPILTRAEVYAVADAIQPRYRALVLLAAFSSLRFGELAALTRHRMGHSTMDAGLRYQHMRGDRDRLIANALDAEIKRAQGKGRKRPAKQDPPVASGA